MSPEPENSRLLIAVTCAPRSVRPANAVGCGCHSTGSTDFSQSRWLISRSVPGIRALKPTSPCCPGSSAVPSEVSEVAVVDGTPAVPGAPTSEERYGAAWA